MVERSAEWRVAPPLDAETDLSADEVVATPPKTSLNGNKVPFAGKPEYPSIKVESGLPPFLGKGTYIDDT